MSSLPPSLVRFESELGEAIGRRGRRRPARLVVRTALATAAVAAIALGTLTAVSGHDPSAVARAAAALTAPSDTIMHVVLVMTTTRPDGTASSERSESWERIGPHNAVREIRSGAAGTYETATVDGETQLYDPVANTVYIQREGPAKEAELRARKAVQVTQAPANDALKAAKAAKAARESTPQRAVVDTDRFRMKITALLGSGAAHEDGHVTVDGRDAIRIVAATEDMSLLVDAGTYEPIEWRVTHGGSTEVTRFPTFERLPATAGSAALLSLVAQHPDATVDRDPTAFQDAVVRLTGKDDDLRMKTGPDKTAVKKSSIPAKPGS